MEIKHDYLANPANYTRGGNECRYIVIHYTANSASARNEARYAQNDAHPSSFHYVLDGIECFQLMEDTDTAWAVGAWSGARQLIGNGESISIEVCNAGGPFDGAEVAQLAELVPLLMGLHGVPAERVVRHWDCHTGRKECPAHYAGENNKAWAELHARITEGDDMSWDEKLKGWNGEVAARDRLAGADKAANDARANSAAILQSLTTDGTGRTDGKMPVQERISYLAMKLDALDAKLDAISDALSISPGDPKVGGTA